MRLDPGGAASHRAVRDVAHLLECFADDLDAADAAAAPTLGEFLDVLGWAVPTDGCVDGVVAAPVTFEARLAGNRRYVPSDVDRVGDLNDAVFGAATDLLASLAADLAAADPAAHPARLDALGGAVLAALRRASVVFADVAAADLAAVTAKAPHPARAPRPGDVLAIPVGGGQHRIAVVVARNRFGTAIGLFDEASRHPRPRRDAPGPYRSQPFYTDMALVAGGTWRTVGADPSLLALFPPEPEIFHRHDPLLYGDQVGPHGAAETAAGVLRQLTEDEAARVGLNDPGYSQTWPSDHLHRAIRDGTI